MKKKKKKEGEEKIGTRLKIFFVCLNSNLKYLLNKYEKIYKYLVSF
jgi:hypothetical protein